MAKPITFLALLLLSACSSDDDSDEANTERDAEVDAEAETDAEQDSGDDDFAILPETLLLNGTAEAEDGDNRVECHFDGMIEMLERAPNGEISGVFLGEIIRNATIGEMGGEFAPLVGGPATLTPIADGRVELRFVGDQPEDALEFWLELEVITGDDDGGFHYSGDWSCAPGLVGTPGFVDVDLTAPGSWTLEPAR
jgi:hypothetical protein